MQTVCRCDRGAYSAKFDEAMKFLGERKRDLDEADPERDRSANSRGRNENIFNAIQEEDDESRYGDGFPAARPRLQADEQQVHASRPEPRLQRAQSNSKSQSSRRDRPSPDQLRHPADPAASRRHRPEAGHSDQSPAEAATGREDPLPPIRDCLPRASPRRPARSRGGVARWTRTASRSGSRSTNTRTCTPSSRSNELDPEEVQAISAALHKKLAALNEEFQAKSHKRFMTPGQARHQQALDEQMKRIEAYLAKLERDTVFYLRK